LTDFFPDQTLKYYHFQLCMVHLEMEITSSPVFWNTCSTCKTYAW